MDSSGRISVIMPIEKDPKKIELTGLQKASLLMIALKIETAAEVFKYLDPTIIETISTEITKIKNIPSQKIDSILEEFYEMIIAREYVIEGGVEYAEALLEKSFGKPKAVEIIDKVKSITTLRGFDVLKKADSMQLINFLNKEHPQTIALILSHLNPTQTAGVLKELPAALRDDVVYRIATLGKISPQTLTQIEKVVDDLAGVSMSQSLSTIGGTKSLAVVLNKSALSLSRDILNKLSEKDPNVATEVKRLMFMFEDIINIQDKDIQRIMRDLDRKDLALSLKIADDKLKAKIFGNMSERAADLLKEEIQYMGMVKLKEVEAAQAKVIDAIKALEDSGEISLNLRGGGEEVYV